jgi:ribosomal protein S18 acetylase RimI-like enzyme
MGDAGLPLAETLEKVKQWYAARNLPAKVSVLADSELDHAVAALGFPEILTPALRQVAPIGGVLGILRASADPQRSAELSARLPGDFFTVYKRGPAHSSAAEVLSSGGVELRFAALRDEAGAAAAVGRLSVDPVSGYAGLSAVSTAEHARRRGHSRVILRDLLQHAHDSGARHVYLEVEPHNAPAVTLYAQLGFVTDHAYHYRVGAM